MIGLRGLGDKDPATDYNRMLRDLAATIAKRSTIRPISVDGPEFWLHEDLVNYTEDVLTIGRTSPEGRLDRRPTDHRHPTRGAYYSCCDRSGRARELSRTRGLSRTLGR